MIKAPPNGGPSQMQMVQPPTAGGQQMMVYIMQPAGAEQQQGGPWFMHPDQMQGGVANGSFAAGDHQMAAMQQQSGPSSWNTWGQDAPNQQFANQPQHQPQQQDFSAGAPWQQHQHQMQDQSQHGWAPAGASTHHQQQQHQQHQLMGNHQQQMMGNVAQQQPMMGNAGQQQPMMGNAGQQSMMGNAGQQQQPMMGNAQQQPMMGNVAQQQQQPMMGNAAGMGQMMPQDNSYGYTQFVPAANNMQGTGSGSVGQNPQAHPQMTPVDKIPAQSAVQAAPAAPAAPPASAAAKPKKKGLMNKKIGKDGTMDQEQQEVAAAAVQQQEVAPQEEAPKVSKESVAPKKDQSESPRRDGQAQGPAIEPLSSMPGARATGTSSATADSRSMIKALNLQPISGPSAKASNRPIPRPGKDGGGMDSRTEQIQVLKDFFKELSEKDRAKDRARESREEEERRSSPERERSSPERSQPTAVKEPVVQRQQAIEMDPAPSQDPSPPMQALVPAPAKTQVDILSPKPQSKGIRLKNASLVRAGDQLKAVPAPESGPDASEDSSSAIRASSQSKEDSAAAEAPKSQPSEDARVRARKKEFDNSILLGRTTGFNRAMMLHFWKASKEYVPLHDLGYRTAVRDEQSPSPGETWRFPRKDRGAAPDSSPSSWRQGASKSGKKTGGSGKDKEVLKPGANAYKVVKATTREAELARDTRSLLNKICPENRERIIERLAQTQFDTVAEMEIVINIIFLKVTDDPHYCETYVDMIHALHKAYPQFPPKEGEQPFTFRRMLVNTCQDKFEELITSPEAQSDALASMEEAESADFLLKQKRSAMATMKFIGHLFVRQLLAAAVIRQVIGDLLNGEPPELQVEYALELVQAVGRQFEATEKDKTQLSVILDRLHSLKVMKIDGKQHLSKRVQFQIQDLYDLRTNGWKARGFKEQAKTKDEVAHDAEREEATAATNQAAARRQGGGGGYGRKH